MDGGLTLPLAPVRVCGIPRAWGSAGRMGRADGAEVGQHCPLCLFKKHWSHKQRIRTINMMLCDIKA